MISSFVAAFGLLIAAVIGLGLWVKWAAFWTDLSVGPCSAWRVIACGFMASLPISAPTLLVVVLFMVQGGTAIAWKCQWHAPMMRHSPAWDDCDFAKTWKMLHP